MENADRELATVHRLTKAMNNAASQSEHDTLKKSLGIANVALAKKRAKVINAHERLPAKKNLDFAWEGVSRSLLSDDQKAQILKEYGRERYLQLPK